MKWLPLILYFFIISSAFALECPEGKYYVNEHFRTDYYRTDGTYVSKADVSEYCKNYRNDGPLKIKFWEKIPKGWPFKNEIFKKCTPLEQKNIKNISYSLPKILTYVGKIKILCAKKSDAEDNPATSSPEGKIIVFYDSAFKMDIKRVLAHELAHFLYNSLSDNEKKLYWKTAKWNSKNSKKIPQTDRVIFSAPDGRFNPEEDFANNVEQFLIEPQKMKNDFFEISKYLELLLGTKK